MVSSEEETSPGAFLEELRLDLFFFLDMLSVVWTDTLLVVGGAFTGGGIGVVTCDPPEKQSDRIISHLSSPFLALSHNPPILCFRALIHVCSGNFIYITS